MNPRALLAVLAAVVVAGCTTAGSETSVPGLADRGTTLTSAKLTRQDLTNKVSLNGKVTLNPTFGLVAPVGGQVRYLDVKEPTATPTKPTRVGGVWAAGKATHVDVPAGSVFAGRLVDDKSTVSAGMPIVSAKYVGYGIVAEIDGAQAYSLTDGLTSVKAQIKSGPGPFDCAVMGTIAALPPGTIPEPPAPQQPPAPQPDPANPSPAPQPPPKQESEKPRTQPSEATGMRLVCTAPADVKLINGASATLEVVTLTVKQALVAPVEAVAGKQGKGKVDVLAPDGSRATKDVVLGLTDGKVVEIKSGLTGDETLAVPGPNLPQAPEQGGGPGGSGAPTMGG